MAEDYFLKVDGIAGESQDERHRGEIEVEGWSFGGAQPGGGQIGVGGGTGEFAALPFQFTAKVSKASPKLFQACATGQHLKVATLGACPTLFSTIPLHSTSGWVISRTPYPMTWRHDDAGPHLPSL